MAIEAVVMVGIVVMNDDNDNDQENDDNNNDDDDDNGSSDAAISASSSPLCSSPFSSLEIDMSDAGSSSGSSRNPPLMRSQIRLCP